MQFFCVVYYVFAVSQSYSLFSLSSLSAASLSIFLLSAYVQNPPNTKLSIENTTWNPSVSFCDARFHISILGIITTNERTKISSTFAYWIRVCLLPFAIIPSFIYNIIIQDSSLLQHMNKKTSRRTRLCDSLWSSWQNHVPQNPLVP